MATTRATRTDPGLWERIKDEVTKGDRGGRAGQWSARKAQLAVQEYKRRGGGYEGRKRADNSLRRWTEEDWGTASGKRSTRTGERYLPKKARDALSDEEYRKTTAKKRADTRKGDQFSRQPKRIAQKTAPYRSGGSDGSDAPSRAELYEQARRRGIPGRSKMDRDELQRALGQGTSGARS
jgi:Family of unknown function (DUF5872)